MGARGGEVGGGLHRLAQPGLQLGEAALREEEARAVGTRGGGHDLSSQRRQGQRVRREGARGRGSKQPVWETRRAVVVAFRQAAGRRGGQALCSGAQPRGEEERGPRQRRASGANQPTSQDGLFAPLWSTTLRRSGSSGGSEAAVGGSLLSLTLPPI